MAEELAELQRKFDALEKDDNEFKAKPAGPAVTKVLQSKQKLRKFSGGMSDPVKDWIADARRFITLQELKDRNAEDFILNHLEGDARNEIRYSLDETECTADELFTELFDAFKERLTSNEALDKFIARKQGDGESLNYVPFGKCNNN